MKHIRIWSPAIALAIVAAASMPARAQQSTAGSAQARTNVIATSFSKSKDITKEKYGIKRRKYLRVESEPVVKTNPADYSGAYRVPGMGFGLELRVNSDGSFDGSGYEPLSENVSRRFVLSGGRIQGALLTATKVYSGGTSEALEGAFMNRSTYQSPTDKGLTVFGLGTLGHPVTVSGMTIDKFFYERVR